MAKRVTLKDVATEAGVHVSTVSRSLDPNTRHAITEDVATHVRRVAARLGYRPNRIAAGLRTNRTMTVGIVIPDITNVLFPPIVRGIETVMEPQGYASILVNTDSDPQREARLLDVLRERGVDGIIHTAALRDDPAILDAARSGLPLVTLNRKVEGTAIPYVINDERGGIAMLVRHLTALGHRAIAHIAGPQDLSTGRMRLEAFREAMAASALVVDERLVVPTARFDESEGARATADLIGKGRHFTAILAANDRLALGAIRQLKTAGLACPRDVSVTGYNDMPFLDMIEPALTTVRIQQFEAGRVAARLLLECLSGTQHPANVVLPVTLVTRESTASPAEGAVAAAPVALRQSVSAP